MNEDPTEKLIRELQEENDRLKAMLESGALPQGTGENGIEAEEGMSPEGKRASNKMFGGLFPTEENSFIQLCICTDTCH